MDRLNFRKKMAVFISLVMIMQVVIGNVGVAEGGTEGGSDNIATIDLYDGDGGSVKYKIKDGSEEYREADAWNKTELTIGNTYDICLNITPDGPRSGSTPVVYNNNTLITINGSIESNSWNFSYTPQAGDNIKVFWSEYDAFSYNDTTEFQIELPSNEKNGNVEVVKVENETSSTVSCNKEHTSYGKKYNISKDDIGNVKLKLKPDANCDLTYICIGEDWLCISDFFDASGNSTEPEKITKDGSGVYTITLIQEWLKEDIISNETTVTRYKSVFIDPVFRENNVATINYYEKDKGIVKYREKLDNNNQDYAEAISDDFPGYETTLAVGKQYDILLEVNENGPRAGGEPVVYIYRGDTTVEYKVNSESTEGNIIDNNGTDNDNVWHFNYTPEAGDFIEVFWSEYDLFGYDEKTQFQVELAGGIENGTISVSQKPQNANNQDDANNICESFSFGKKYNYKNTERTGLKIIFTPEKNCTLEKVWIDGERYDRGRLDDTSTDNIFKKTDDGKAYELTLTENQIIRDRFTENEVETIIYKNIYINAFFKKNVATIDWFDDSNGDVEYSLDGGTTKTKVVFEGDENNRIIKNNELVNTGTYDFYLTEKNNRIGSQPFVFVENDGVVIHEYRFGNGDRDIDEASDNDNATWHFKYTFNPGDLIRIYWSKYDAFEYDREKEFQICLQSKIDNGTVSFNPSADDKNDDSEYGKKYNFSKEQLENLEIIFTPNENCELEKIRVEGVDVSKDSLENINGTYKYKLTGDIVKQGNEYRSIYIEPFFKSNNPEGGSGGPGPEIIDENNANKIAEHGYAYYVDTTQTNKEETFKNYLATEIWYEYFNTGRPAAGLCGITTSDILKSRLTLEYKTKDNSSVPNLDYYEYKIRKNENGENTNTYLVQGKAYILYNAKDFIVNIGDEYTVVKCSSDNNALKDNIYIKSNKEITSSDNIKIFGNGVCGFKLDSSSQFTYGFHITQEHSGLGSDSTIGNLGCKLIVCANAFKGLSIQGNRNAAAWDFNSTGVYDTGTQTNPAIAEVFYGNNSFTMEDIKFDNDESYPNITSIVLDSAKISSSAAKIVNSNGEYTITFESGYDMIPLIIGYNDGTIRYVTLNRVGLKIDKNNIDNNNKFEAWHGTDHTVTYSATGDKAIYATFYYLGADAPTSHVQLFATITKSDGTVERKMINNPLTGGTKPIWDNREEEFNPNKASQGTDKYLDDFQIWSGSDEEFKNIDKVEVIAYNSGDDNGFGGVKVGSDAGVVWINK